MNLTRSSSWRRSRARWQQRHCWQTSLLADTTEAEEDSQGNSGEHPIDGGTVEASESETETSIAMQAPHDVPFDSDFASDGVPLMQKVRIRGKRKVLAGNDEFSLPSLRMQPAVTWANYAAALCVPVQACMRLVFLGVPLAMLNSLVYITAMLPLQIDTVTMVEYFCWNWCGGGSIS